jgi:hypothetical protein
MNFRISLSIQETRREQNIHLRECFSYRYNNKYKNKRVIEITKNQTIDYIFGRGKAMICYKVY